MSKDQRDGLIKDNFLHGAEAHRIALEEAERLSKYLGEMREFFKEREQKDRREILNKLEKVFK